MWCFFSLQTFNRKRTFCQWLCTVLHVGSAGFRHIPQIFCQIKVKPCFHQAVPYFHIYIVKSVGCYQLDHSIQFYFLLPLCWGPQHTDPILKSGAETLKKKKNTDWSIGAARLLSFSDVRSLKLNFYFFFFPAANSLRLAACSFFLKQSLSPCCNKQPHTERKEHETWVLCVRSVCLSE